ncbi:hypothetical protein H0H93_006558 [Arthromyces matolae]|nr:hypothetical protein H0H93_006558 [Arthromyces matolae]
MKVSGLSDNMTTEQAPSQQEEESVSMLAGMMDVDSETARRVLRKHKGDVEKAADAMLSGDKGDEPPPLLMWPGDANQETGFVDPFTVTPPSAPQAQVIDLTADDDDKTFQLSQAQNDVKFGPSQRAPNPSWQMVTTNTPVDTTHDDRAMNEAIQASLADMNASEDDLEMRPMEDSIRESGRPVALRTESSDIAYAALVRISSVGSALTHVNSQIVQALAQIPQIRHHIATLYDPIDGKYSTTRDSLAHLQLESLQRPEWCSQLVELFANLDLAQLSAIIDKEVLPRRNPPRWNGTHESLGSGSAGKIISTIRLASPAVIPLVVEKADIQDSIASVYSNFYMPKPILEVAQSGSVRTPIQIIRMGHNTAVLSRSRQAATPSPPTILSLA